MSARDVERGTGVAFVATVLESVAAVRSLLIEEIAMRGPAPLDPHRPIPAATRR
jgi:hypothetical protein